MGVHGGPHVTYLTSTLLERVDPAFAIGIGPASWLLTGLACTVVAAVALWMLSRRGAPGAAEDHRHPAHLQ